MRWYSVYNGVRCYIYSFKRNNILSPNVINREDTKPGIFNKVQEARDLVLSKQENKILRLFWICQRQAPILEWSFTWWRFATNKPDGNAFAIVRDLIVQGNTSYQVLFGIRNSILHYLFLLLFKSFVFICFLDSIMGQIVYPFTLKTKLNLNEIRMHELCTKSDIFKCMPLEIVEAKISS